MSKEQLHFKILDQLHTTYINKNKDYGDSFGKLFEEYGEVSSAIRLQDKLNRFKQLIEADAQVKSESKEDTLLDMANYCVMTVIELRNIKYQAPVSSYEYPLAEDVIKGETS